MKKKRIYIITVIIIIVVFAIFVIELQNPLRKSEEEISEHILTLIPMGSDIEEVIGVIEAHKMWGWKWDGRILPRGIFRSVYIPNPVGCQSLKVILGSYMNPFHTMVVAWLGFDENSKLIDIWVKKDTDVI